MTVPIPKEAIEAAAREVGKHFEWPFMARVRNFSAEQVAAGELRAADEQAQAQNRAAVRAVVEAAAPLIVAAELDRLKQLAITSNPREMVMEIARRASVLRGEGAS